MRVLLLVRHAVALRRSEWDGADELRPLSERGFSQAEALVGLLAGYDVTRVLSSPSLRCVQTVTPLAHDRGVAVERAEALAEGGTAAAVRLVHGIEEGAVLCSHGDVIPEVLDSLDAGGHLAGVSRCEKGSTWVLVRRPDGTMAGDRYLPPPE
ncbi:MAG TPA: phosphoglycerate mutase family protein [Acidimicrobiales bacterium]|nr:phosphoglycerate mutase family protein [Acidimicrobiales bacterium]